MKKLAIILFCAACTTNAPKPDQPRPPTYPTLPRQAVTQLPVCAHKRVETLNIKTHGTSVVCVDTEGKKQGLEIIRDVFGRVRNNNRYVNDTLVSRASYSIDGALKTYYKKQGAERWVWQREDRMICQEKAPYWYMERNNKIQWSRYTRTNISRRKKQTIDNQTRHTIVREDGSPCMIYAADDNTPNIYVDKQGNRTPVKTLYPGMKRPNNANKKRILDAVRQKQTQLIACYHDQKPPEATRRFVIEFAVSDKGVYGVAIHKSPEDLEPTIRQNIERCFVKTFYQLSLKQPQGMMVIRYPLVFDRSPEDKKDAK